MVDQGQSYLEALSITEMLLKKMDAETRTQIHKSITEEVYKGVDLIVNKIGVQDAPLWIPDFTASLKDYSKSDVTYLSNTMKTTIVDALKELKTDIARRTYSYYTTHEFSPREKTIPLLRECVRLYHFG